MSARREAVYQLSTVTEKLESFRDSVKPVPCSEPECPGVVEVWVKEIIDEYEYRLKQYHMAMENALEYAREEGEDFPEFGIEVKPRRQIKYDTDSIRAALELTEEGRKVLDKIVTTRIQANDLKRAVKNGLISEEFVRDYVEYDRTTYIAKKVED